MIALGLLILLPPALRAGILLGNQNNFLSSNTTPQTFEGSALLGTNDAAFWNILRRDQGVVTNTAFSPFTGATSGQSFLLTPTGVAGGALYQASFDPQAQVNRTDLTLTVDFMIPTLTGLTSACIALDGSTGDGVFLQISPSDGGLLLTSAQPGGATLATLEPNTWYRLVVTLPAGTNTTEFGNNANPPTVFVVSLTQFGQNTVNLPVNYNFAANPSSIDLLQIGITGVGSSMYVDNVGVSTNPFGQMGLNRGAWADKMPDAMWDRAFINLNTILYNGTTFSWDQTVQNPASQGVNGRYYGDGCFGSANGTPPWQYMPTDRNWVLCLVGLPSWLCTSGTTQQPNNWASYQAMIKWVISQFPPQVKVLEMSNEITWWGPTPGWQDAQHMADYISNTAQAKNASSRPDLILTGPTWTQPVYWETPAYNLTQFETLANTESQGQPALTWLDAISMHNYAVAGPGTPPANNPPAAQFDAWLSALQAWYGEIDTLSAETDGNGVSLLAEDVPHYWTEFGWPLTSSDSWSEFSMDDQATFISRGLTAMKAYNAAGILPFSLTESAFSFYDPNVPSTTPGSPATEAPRPSYYAAAFAMSWLKNVGAATLTQAVGHDTTGSYPQGKLCTLDFGDRIVIWDSSEPLGETYPLTLAYPIVGVQDMYGVNLQFSSSGSTSSVSVGYHPIFVAKNAGITSTILYNPFDDPALLNGNDAAFWNVLRRDQGLVVNTASSPLAEATNGQSFQLTATGVAGGELYAAGFTPQEQDGRTNMTLTVDLMIPSSALSKLTHGVIAIGGIGGNGPYLSLTPNGSGGISLISSQSGSPIITTFSADIWYRITVAMPAAAPTTFTVTSGPVDGTLTDYPTSYDFNGSPSALNILEVGVSGIGASMYIDNVAIQMANP